jgi:hypothetical protein
VSADPGPGRDAGSGPEYGSRPDADSGPTRPGPDLLTFLVGLGALGGALLILLGLPLTGGVLLLLSLAGHFARPRH